VERKCQLDKFAKKEAMVRKENVLEEIDKSPVKEIEIVVVKIFPNNNIGVNVVITDDQSKGNDKE
jgi:hypothetical protein